jgi:CubicO group peptidase (beta-lactamase class C family)
LPRIAATAFAVALLAFVMTNLDPGPPRQVVDNSADSALAGLVKPGQPGFALLLRYRGGLTIQRSYGVRALRSKALIDASTNFRLASFTKQFTAMAIMLLVHDGKLRYDQDLASIWPDFPDYGKAITVRQLLNHTSGLPDYEYLMEAVEKSQGPRWSPEKQIQDEEVFALLKAGTHAKFAPGTNWSYSNSGYVLLGLVVAKISGVSYPEFLRTRIFAPLHMDHTIVYVKGKSEVSNRAYGHTRDADSFRETDQSATSATLGDGGIYSNLLDLAKWDDALRNHTLLSAEEMQPALTPAKLSGGSQPHWPAEPGDENLHPGKPVSYGFGWFLDPYKVPGTSESAFLHPRMYHTGTTVGFRTAIERFTQQPLTVIVLCNRTDLDPQTLAHKIADNYPPLK